jgi:hypothetical protein
MIVILSRDRRLDRASCQNSVGAAKIEPAINLSRPEAIFSLPSNRPLSRAACGLTSSPPQKARRRAGVSATRGKPARPDVNFPRDPASWRGWMGFNFEEAFKRPTKIINDAAMQALFKEALDPKFTDYQKQVLENSRTMARVLTERSLRIVSGGTEMRSPLGRSNSSNLDYNRDAPRAGDIHRRLPFTFLDMP